MDLMLEFAQEGVNNVLVTHLGAGSKGKRHEDVVAERLYEGRALPSLREVMGPAVKSTFEFLQATEKRACTHAILVLEERRAAQNVDERADLSLSSSGRHLRGLGALRLWI
jgi:hypothetical protein